MSFIKKVLPKKRPPKRPAVLDKDVDPDDKRFKNRGKVIGVSDAELEEIFRHILKDDDYLSELTDLAVQIKLAKSFPDLEAKRSYHNDRLSHIKSNWLRKMSYFQDSPEKDQMMKDYDSFESALELAKSFKRTTNYRTIDYFFLTAILGRKNSWYPYVSVWRESIDALERHQWVLDIGNWSEPKIKKVQDQMLDGLKERGLYPLERH